MSERQLDSPHISTPYNYLQSFKDAFNAGLVVYQPDLVIHIATRNAGRNRGDVRFKKTQNGNAHMLQTNFKFSLQITTQSFLPR